MSDAGARALITPQLWANEEIVWADQPLAAGPVAAAAARKGFYGAVGVAVSVFVFAQFARGAFNDLDPETSRKILVASVIAAGATLAFGAISSWSRARRLAHLVAYAVTNRRIIMVQGEALEWVSLRELEDVRVSGNSLVFRRGKTQTEHFWASQSNRGELEPAEAVGREVTLAALPDPQRVLQVIQTLQQRTAS